MSNSQPLTVSPGTKIRLKDFDAGYKGDFDKASANAKTQEYLDKLDDLIYRLYAEHKQSLLLVLQGMDTSGKDGTIRHVMSGISPQSCQVASFKQPTALELDHDFLWRIHREVPRRGMVGIFNRSHYEDVLVVRVHKLVSEETWKARYEAINTFEDLLSRGGMHIVKIYLHISKEEQRERLQARIDDKDKRWKFSKADLAERKFWDDYREAYDDALTKCNTENAPWHIVPANHKWYRNLVVSEIVYKTLKKMDPAYPKVEEGLEGLVIE